MVGCKEIRTVGDRMRVQFPDAPKCPKCGIHIGFLNHFDENSETGKCPCCGKTLKKTSSFNQTSLKLVG